MRTSSSAIVISAAVVLSILLAAWFYFTRFDVHQEIMRMRAAMRRVETADFAAGASWTRDASGRDNTTALSSGQFRFAPHPAFSYRSEFHVIQAREGRDVLNLKGELRRLDDGRYVTFDPPGPDGVGFNFSEPGLWVHVPDAQWGLWKETAPPVPWPAFRSFEVADLSDETFLTLRELLLSTPVLNADFSGEMQEIRGVQTRVIDARFDPQASETALRRMLELLLGSLDDTDLLSAKTDAAVLSRLHVKLWIGVKDHLLYRAQAAGFIPKDAESPDRVLDFRLELSNVNAPFTVSAPAYATSFADILRKRSGTLPEAEQFAVRPEGAASLASETPRLPVEAFDPSVVDEDEDGLSATLEAFYLTDPHNPDTDGDGVSDGDEVFAGKNPNGTGSLFGFGLGQ